MNATPSPAPPSPAPPGLPVGDAKVRAVDRMFDAIAPRYDLVNRVMTFGLDVVWRRRTVRSLRLPPGAVVVDVACGTGDLCRGLAAAGYRPAGVDRSAGMLGTARRRTDAPLVRGDALRLPLPDASVDGLVCGFGLRNVADLPAFLAEAARVTRRGGRIALLEVSRPTWAPARTLHRLHFERVVPFLGGLLSDRAAYRYLPESVAYLPPDAELVAMLAAAGFPDAARHPLTLGAAQLLTGTRS